MLALFGETIPHAMNMQPFSYQETHRVIHQKGNLVHQSSENAGWQPLYASVQTEAAYEGFFPAVADHLLVIPLKQPVHFTRRVGGELQERILPPGSVTITPGGADFTVRTASENGLYDTIHLYIRNAAIAEMYMEISGGAGKFTLPPSIGATSVMIQGIALELRQMLDAPDRSDLLYVETLSRSLAGCLVRPHTRAREIDARAALSPQQRDRAIQYIQEFLHDDLNLSGIARAAGVNTGRLAREFKKSAGLSPYEYVVRALVDRARYLLTETGLSLAEIAALCGFSHQQHMTRMFRRITGATPGTFRRGSRPG